MSKGKAPPGATEDGSPPSGTVSPEAPVAPGDGSRTARTGARARSGKLEASKGEGRKTKASRGRKARAQDGVEERSSVEGDGEKGPDTARSARMELESPPAAGGEPPTTSQPAEGAEPGSRGEAGPGAPDEPDGRDAVVAEEDVPSPGRVRGEVAEPAARLGATEPAPPEGPTSSRAAAQAVPDAVLDRPAQRDAVQALGTSATGLGLRVPPPRAFDDGHAPRARRRQLSRAPVVEDRLVARQVGRTAPLDDRSGRTARRPVADRIPAAGPTSRAAATRTFGTANASDADWPFDTSSSASVSGRPAPERRPSLPSPEMQETVKDVLTRLRPASAETMRVTTPSSLLPPSPGSRVGEPSEAPEADSIAPQPRATSVADGMASIRSALLDDGLEDDGLNPFARREEPVVESDRGAAPGSRPAPFESDAPDSLPRTPGSAASTRVGPASEGERDDMLASFLASPESTPEGLRALLGNLGRAEETPEEPAKPFEPDGLRSLVDSLGPEPSERQNESALDSMRFESSPPKPVDSVVMTVPLSNPMPSSLGARPGPSNDALDDALGGILGSKFPAAVQSGMDNLAVQLDELLRDAERARAEGPEVSFDGVQPGFDDDDLVPAPAATLRGASQADDEFDFLAANRQERGWDDMPDSEAPTRAAMSLVDVDPSDVMSIEPSLRRWSEEDDDRAVTARRSDQRDLDHPDEDLGHGDGEAPPPSEWGTVPPPPNAVSKEIPNYETALESLAKPRSAATPAGAPRPASVAPRSTPPGAPRAVPRRAEGGGRGLRFATALVVGAVLVTLLPWYMLTRAEKYATNCFRDVLRTAEGDPEACLPTASDLALARHLPWLAEDAKRVKEWADFRAARLAYDKATAIVPNAVRRDEAAARLLELTYRGSSHERTTALGVVAGAHEAVARFALANREPEAVSFALRSARALGDLDGMRSLATGDAQEDLFGMSLRRGALLCLLGDANEGARAFVAADVAQQRLSSNQEGHGLARLGLVACGRPRGVDGEIDARRIQDRFRPALAALEASLDTQEGFAQARVFLESGKSKVGGIQRLRIAPYVIRETKPSAIEALRLMAPQHAPAARLDLPAARTPWTMLDVEAPVQAVYVDPRAAEVAGPYLTKLAEKLGGKPIDCSGEECPDAAALKMPDAILKEAARMIWFEAAAEHARLGQREAALEAARRAAEVSVPTRRYLLAPVHLAVGDAEGALALLATALDRLDGYSASAQARIHLNHGLALAHLGQHEEALAAAEQAFAAATRAEEQSSRTEADALDAEVAVQEDRVAAAWLWAAMGLVTGKPDGVGAMLRDARTKELAEVATWLGLATRPEEERRAERWDLALVNPSQPALPAVMYVVSRAVPSMTDVEVWLDRIFQQEQRTQPTRSMLARAEAARWRNDPEPERAWQARAAKMLGLIKDYRTSLLAHILELH